MKVAYQTAVPAWGLQRRSAFRPSRLCSDTTISARHPAHRGDGDGEGETTLSQTCLWPRPQAQFAFKDSMIHMILQFTLGIAFRCVLHRCGSQDIRC